MVATGIDSISSAIVKISFFIIGYIVYSTCEMQFMRSFNLFIGFFAFKVPGYKLSPCTLPIQL